VLTPVDIENKEFAKAFRGYDSIEVDEFMRSLVADYEKLYRENGSLKEKNAMLTETLENYKGMENTMQNAILVAQKTAEDIKQNAYDRSNTITKEAEIKAGNIIAEAEKRSTELEKEYSSLKKEMNTFKARMNSLLHTYLRLLEDSAVNSYIPSTPSPETISDLEKNIEKIQKQNKERNMLEDDALKSQPNNEASDNTYTPKKINPLVDELLKKRAEGESIDKNNDKNVQENKPEEMIIDLSPGNNKQYDVFKDKTL